MSNEALTWAAKRKTGSAPNNFVLFVLANYADQDWSCYPSVASIVEVTELSERTVRRAIAELHANGNIRILYRYRANGSRRSNRYQLLPDGPATPLPEADDWTEEKADTMAGEGDQVAGCSGHGGTLPLPQGPVIPSTDTSLDPSPVARPPKGADRATRVPEDFQPSEDMRSWYLRERLGEVLDGRREHEQFMDYWRAVPGARGRKLDWPATWRRWMREAVERAQRNGRRPSGPPAAYRSTTDERVGAALELARQYEEQGL